jgi:hypothetical protein
MKTPTVTPSTGATSRAAANKAVATAVAAAAAIFMLGAELRFVVIAEAFTFQQPPQHDIAASPARRLATTSNSQVALRLHNREQQQQQKNAGGFCHEIKRCGSRQPQHQQPLLAVYSAAADDIVESSSSPREEEGQTTAWIARGYRMGQYVFGATAAILLCIPDRTLTAQLAAKLGGAAGYGLAAGVSYILAKAAAASKQQLNSETYKRLNVGLLGFSIMGLAAVPGEAGFFYTLAPAMILSAMLLAVHVFGMVVSYTGWKYAVVDVPRMTLVPDDPTATDRANKSNSTPISSEIQQLAKELWRGTKSTVEGCWRVQNTKKALTYRNCLLLVLTGCFSHFMDGIFHLRYQDVFHTSWFESSLAWSGVARLFFISTMVYSLKDAAERDRLTGTTFIQINVMIGAWAALVGLGQAINPLGMQGYRGVTMFSLSLPFFIKAIKAIKQKKEMENSPSDEAE